MSTNLALAAWRRMSALPLGSRVLSRLAAVRVPYFRSIAPHITVLEPGRCEVEMRKRRSVTNHLGTVHAIAMCNLAEVAGGLTAEVSTPSTHRWIPKGMTVEYLAKAGSDLRGVCNVPLPSFGAKAFEWPLDVDVYDGDGEKVFHACITMWITPRS